VAGLGGAPAPERLPPQLGQGRVWRRWSCSNQLSRSPCLPRCRLWVVTMVRVHGLRLLPCEVMQRADTTLRSGCDLLHPQAPSGDTTTAVDPGLSRNPARVEALVSLARSLAWADRVGGGGRGGRPRRRLKLRPASRATAGAGHWALPRGQQRLAGGALGSHIRKYRAPGRWEWSGTIARVSSRALTRRISVGRPRALAVPVGHPL
jgi:hypothetical protein